MPLRIDLRHERLPWSDETDQSFRRAVRRLRDRLSRFNLRAERLEATFEPEGSGVRARLELKLPDDVQTAMVVEDGPLQAIRSGFTALFRRFDSYAWSIDHSTWRPLASTTQTDPHQRLQSYRAELMRYAMPALHRVATYEIDRLQNEGELLAPDWLDPAEVVDNALVDRLPTLRPSTPLPEATMQLIAAVREELLARITELHERQNEDLSFEEPMGPSLILTDAEEGELPLEVLELNLSDVLSDPEADEPETLVIERQRRDQLTAALFELPDPYRPLFAQVVIDDWPEDMVAAAWQVPLEEVRRVVREAAYRLAQRLDNRPVRQIISLYRALGAQRAGERQELEPV